MISERNFYRSAKTLNFTEKHSNFQLINSYVFLDEQESLPEILFVTSFPPRECGIATYSQDLINALNNQFENSFKLRICALESDIEQHTYAEEPTYILNTDQTNSFLKRHFKSIEIKKSK